VTPVVSKEADVMTVKRDFSQYLTVEKVLCGDETGDVAMVRQNADYVYYGTTFGVVFQR
jgi:hypothetical protein